MSTTTQGSVELMLF